jgi:hypothetical protein
MKYNKNRCHFAQKSHRFFVTPFPNNAYDARLVQAIDF